MPVLRCPNGKYRIGSGKCIYDSKEKAERAYKGYLGAKHGKYDFTVTKFGGEGSGHHGHEGIRGHHGGSKPGEGGFVRGLLAGITSIAIMDVLHRGLYQIGKSPTARRRLFRRLLKITKLPPLRTSVVLGSIIVGTEVYDKVRDKLKERKKEFAQEDVEMGTPVIGDVDKKSVIASSLGQGDYLVMFPEGPSFKKLDNILPLGPPIVAKVGDQTIPYIPIGKDKKIDNAYAKVIKEGLEEVKKVIKEENLLNSNFKG